jgi:acyl-[acyl-carrier-protein]-phospholipid O-acyltransferase / long-chain-fatty-acid--[acyl-carrier-protein] ligase
VDQPIVGLMLPASVGGALANIATFFAGKVPVNLNFTAGRESVDAAIKQCGIRTIVTSRIFITKAKIDEQPGMVFLEDLLRGFSARHSVSTALLAWLLPTAVLLRLYTPERIGTQSLATVIFSSGSTGEPKGVMLSHCNILAVLEGMAQVYSVTPHDRIIGVLPFFHSFGFNGTLWFPLISGFGALYVPNPMDAKTVGELARRFRATMIIGTPTFFTAYIRKCTKEDFEHLRYAVTGAEKLREPIARGFREKFGVDILEGYGCTEMAPVISVNMPDPPEEQVGSKAGTVGHPLPGVVVRVVDPESGEARPSGREGLLLVRGPNRMLGYLGKPEATAAVLRDGWYVTGDIAAVDEDGFIRLTDRLSRFSKIAGEMVPHLKIEEVATQVLDDPNCVVTSVPDEARGERLVLLYTNAAVSPEQLWSALGRSELPKLWVPKRGDIHRIDAIPLLGTGKVDLRQVRRLADSMVQA